VLVATALMSASFLFIIVGTQPVTITQVAAAGQTETGIFGLQIVGVLLSSAQSGLGEASFFD
jgi:hypothetical protein